MNSGTFEIKCGVCGRSHSISAKFAKKPFFHAPCSNSECKFPMAYLNESATGYNPHKIREYITAVEQWAYDRLKLHKALKSQQRDLQNRNNTPETQQRAIETPPKIESVNKEPVNTHAVQFSHQTSENAPNVDLAVFEQQLAESNFIVDIQQMLQSIDERLASFEVRQMMPFSQPVENAAQNLAKYADTTSVQRHDVQVGDEQPREIEYVPESEQIQAKKSQWLELYNTHLDQFTHQCETQLVGATKETLEASRLNRLSQNGEALFETGNGNYWLLLSNQKNVAFLMPNRKRIRFNQNVLDSVRVCFYLTHYSIENLSFDGKSANFDQFRMLLPAIVDSVNGGLWRLRQKGVLLFPIQEVVS